MNTKQKKGLEFHLKSNDYFGTLATRIELVRQIANEQGLIKQHSDILATCADELVHLQRHYEIHKKSNMK